MGYNVFFLKNEQHERDKMEILTYDGDDIGSAIITKSPRLYYIKPTAIYLSTGHVFIIYGKVLMWGTGALPIKEHYQIVEGDEVFLMNIDEGVGVVKARSLDLIAFERYETETLKVVLVPPLINSFKFEVYMMLVPESNAL